MQNGKYLLDQLGPLEGTRVADMTRLAAGISPPERWTKILPISTRWESRSARFAAWPISSITRLFAAAASSKISRTRNTVRSRCIRSSRDSARRRAPAPILGEHTEEVLQLLSRSIVDTVKQKKTASFGGIPYCGRVRTNVLTPFPFNKRP